MIRVPAFPVHLTAATVHRDEFVVSSPQERLVVAGPWCGELASRIDGRRTALDLVSELAACGAGPHALHALLHLEQRGLLVEAANLSLDADSRLWRLADPHLGLIPWLQRRQTPSDFSVVYAPQLMPAASEPRSGDLARLAIGTGLTESEAALSCVGEAVERFSACFHGTERIVRARAGELDAPCVLPSSLLLISAAQYRDRERFNGAGLGELWLPEAPDESLPLDWTPLWSLTRRQTCYVPAAYCFLRYPAELPGSFAGDSNGCAAGRSLSDAIERGFYELAERDAIALWWYNRIPRAALDLSLAGDGLGPLFAQRLAQAGRSLALLDLTNDLGIPVVAAVTARFDGSAVAFGFGAGLRIARAARRALLEMQQVLGAVESPGSDGWLARWIAAVNLHREPWLAPDPAARPLARDLPLHPGTGSDLDACLDAAHARGLEVLAADLTRPGMDVPVARVIVPGLRPAAPRFAPGRLYQAPCNLGWRRTPLSESDLNPFPFFL